MNGGVSGFAGAIEVFFAERRIQSGPGEEYRAFGGRLTFEEATFGRDLGTGESTDVRGDGFGTGHLEVVRWVELMWSSSR